MNVWDTIIIGGGAGGFFTAINYKEKAPQKSVLIIEKDKEVLRKVRISGGGRCNVTHACFTPKDLSKFYPRGEKELIGPFHQFCTGDMMGWLDDHGIATKIEADNRVFPASNTSQSIIDLFLDLIKKYNIKLSMRTRLDAISKENDLWLIRCADTLYYAKKIVIATGSNPKVWQLIERDLDHPIEKPVPSLFTFNIKDSALHKLMGISIPNAQIEVVDTPLKANGPLLITHWGLSGPAILKLSAWGARKLHDLKYTFKIKVNYMGNSSLTHTVEKLKQFKSQHSKKNMSQHPYDFPKRLWLYFLDKAKIEYTLSWANLSYKVLEKLAKILCQDMFTVSGKSTFKDEFVTAGGVSLKEIDFKRFESKKHKNLFFVGEVLDIDAITGGFNFQAAWTGGYIAAKSLAT